jgi:hypothetical protein
MKKQLLWLLLMLPLAAFTYAEWVSFKLDDRATINFPAQPETKDVNGNNMWLKDVDENGRCMAMVVDFAKFGTDSAGLAAELQKEGTYEMFKNSMLAQMPGATAISDKVTPYKGRPGYQIIVNATSANSKLDRVYMQMVFAGTKMYALSFYEGSAKPQEANRNKFLNSLVVK